MQKRKGLHLHPKTTKCSPSAFQEPVGKLWSTLQFNQTCTLRVIAKLPGSCYIHPQQGFCWDPVDKYNCSAEILALPGIS